MIVLIEGLDKTGKSTDAKALAALADETGEFDQPARVLHFGVPKTNPYQDYREALRDADAYDGPTIIDRLHWSEEAYGQMFRRDDAKTLSPARIDALDQLLFAFGGVVLLKTRDPREIAAALDEDDSFSMDAGQVSLLQSCFHGRARRTINHVRIIPFPESGATPSLVERASEYRRNMKGSLL